MIQHYKRHEKSVEVRKFTKNRQNRDKFKIRGSEPDQTISAIKATVKMLNMN